MSTPTVRVVLNGEPMDVPGGSRLLDVLAGLGVDVARVAIERNREVVPRTAQGDVVVADGDVYEIVQFVGGG